LGRVKFLSVPIKIILASWERDSVRVESCLIESRIKDSAGRLSFSMFRERADSFTKGILTVV